MYLANIMFSLTIPGILCSGNPVPCRDESNQNQIITTCTRCIWQLDCAWCPHIPSGERLAVGCIKNDGSYQCPVQIIGPKEKGLTVNVKADPLSQSPSVQISPQIVNAEVNPVKPTVVNFEVSLSENPVDIYFVMDLSNSMRVHQENLVGATAAIAEKIQQITSDYRLGFGSFSDKPTQPFSSERSYYNSSGKPIPYAFRHQLSLTTDTDHFKNNVQAAGLAANIDSPEAGLDALVQTITCEKVIGWRKDVRRVIIFVTDEEPHFALDGILGGIIMPNDGVCATQQSSVDGDFQYVDELIKDYPSFSQVRELMSANEMPVIIFAVDEGMKEIYDELSSYIQGTKNVGILTKNPLSIEDIVVKQYRAIKSRMVVISDFDSSKIKVDLKSDCEKPESLKNQEICHGVLEKAVINYKANISVEKRQCLDHDVIPREEFFTEINFDLFGFTKDDLKVNVRCEQCSCLDKVVPNAPECSSRGNFACGGCECHRGYSGKNCDCDLNSIGGGSLLDSCRPDNSSEICNQHGDCACGHCQCTDQFLGEFCQCRYDSCPEIDGKVCNGNGYCQCQGAMAQTKCQCKDGFSGDKCDCPTSDDQCRDSMTNMVCSGQGSCQCGKCKCNLDSEGKYCQRSKAKDTCEKLFPCIEHHQFKNNISESQMIEWESECKENTERNKIQLFGQNIIDGCQLVTSTNDSSAYGDLNLYYKSGNQIGCQAIFEELSKFGQFNTTDSETEEAQRGDQKSDEQDPVKQMTTSKMIRCVLSHERCEVVFFHEDLENDEFFEEKRLGKIFVVKHNATDDGSWSPLVHCTEIPMAIVLGSTMGILFLICLAAFIAILVLINIRDRHAWKRYIAMREENEGRLGHFQNPLYQEQQQSTFQNPAFNN